MREKRNQRNAIKFWNDISEPEEMKLAKVKKLDCFEILLVDWMKIRESMVHFTESTDENIMWSLDHADKFIFNNFVIKILDQGEVGKRNISYIKFEVHDGILWIEDYTFEPVKGIRGRTMSIGIDIRSGDDRRDLLDATNPDALIDAIVGSAGYHYLPNDLLSLGSECEFCLKEAGQTGIVNHTSKLNTKLKELGKMLWSGHDIGLCYGETNKFHAAGTEDGDFNPNIVLNFMGMASTVIYANLYFHKSIIDRETTEIHVSREKTVKKTSTPSVTKNKPEEKPRHKITINNDICIYTHDADAIKSFRTRRPCDHAFSVRGHERHYKNGKVVWVKPYVKNNKALIFEGKDIGVSRKN